MGSVCHNEIITMYFTAFFTLAINFINLCFDNFTMQGKTTSMLKACIFPKSITKWGGIFKSMNCAIFSCIWSNIYANHVETHFWWFKCHQMGRYPRTYLPTLKLTFSSRLHKSSDPLFLLPHFAIKACRTDFVYSIHFCFSFYCACASFNHKLIYLYALLEMEKGGAPLFLK